MTCPNCGAAVAENRRFCGKCGTDLAPDASAAPAPSPYAPPADAPTAPAPPSAWGTTPSMAPASTPTPPPGQPGPGDPFAPPNLDPGAYAGYPPPPGYPAGPPPQYPSPPGYPGGAPGWPGYGYAPPHTSGLAIASLVLGLIGWMLCGVGSVIAIVLGYIARNQIKQSWGRETGSGMATAGIILGFIGLALWMALFIAGLLGNSS